MKPILNLLFNFWKLEKPNLIISVTGGAQNYTLKPRLRDVFRKGLVKAATSTSKKQIKLLDCGCLVGSLGLNMQQVYKFTQKYLKHFKAVVWQ